MKESHIIVDCQFGSTGKGLLIGYLAETIKPDTCIIAWGSNAGHTYINAAGRKFVNIMMPNGIVSPNLKQILMGPGSIIDPDRLLAEIREFGDLLGGVRIAIHANAAIITKEHKEQEAGYGFKIGSTMKGVGAAVIQKIRREPDHMNVAYEALKGTALEHCVVSAAVYDELVDAADVSIIEGTQGFSLSMNQGFYPYVTSRDCTTLQVLSDCAVPFNALGWRDRVQVYGVARTYPIRVANRFRDGVQVGTSGPCYPDQKELQWSEINGGMEAELTTVTKLPRRIFSFSHQQIKAAVRANGCDSLFLNFCNYLSEEEAGKLVREIEGDEGPDGGCWVRYTGHGPTFNDVREREPSW